MTKLKLIKGERRELEYQLLAALFTPGGGASAEALKQRLTPRGKDRLRAVRTPRLHDVPTTPPTIEDAT
jgi:hypothetical protein